MIKDFLLVRSAAAVSRKRVQNYLEFEHAPLALSVPIISRKMRLYTMNHVRDDTGADGCIYPSIAGVVSVVEHGLGGWDSLNEILADPQYLSSIRPDEEYMVENLMAGWPQFIVIDEQHEIFESEAPGSVRMFDLLRRPMSVDREEFLGRLAEEAHWACTDRAYRSAIGRRVHSLATGGSAPIGREEEVFDAVVEVWITNRGGLMDLMDEQRSRRARFCDPNRSFTALTQESRIRG